MKKLYVLLVAAGLFVAGAASAQTKIAYIRIDDIVGLMPELAPEKINMDTVGQQFIKDSIMPRIEYVQGEYQRKLGEYTDTTKPVGVREQIYTHVMNSDTFLVAPEADDISLLVLAKLNIKLPNQPAKPGTK